MTGGAGFIGSALVKALLKRGNDVKVLVRKKSDLRNLEGLPVEMVYGDLYHLESVRNAVHGSEIVYHTASRYQFYPWWKKKIAPIYKINIQGTRNMIACAKEANVKRFIYTSSIITVGKDEQDGLSDESTPFSDLQRSSHYARTKYKAESIVLEEAKKGFPAVVVNPGMTFGEGDYKPTPSGDPILKFLNRIYPGYFHTIWSVADVDDVAEGHIAACEKGKMGERYILCNREHYSMRDIFKILEKITGIRSPFLRIPFSLLLPFVYADEWTAQWFPHKPLLALEGVRFCKFSLRCDHSKAVRELSYRTTPFEKTLEKAVKWYRDHGFVKRSSIKMSV